MDARFDAIDARLDSMSEKLDTLDEKVDVLDERLFELNRKVTTIDDNSVFGFAQIQRQLEAHRDFGVDKLRDHEGRITSIEGWVRSRS